MRPAAPDRRVQGLRRILVSAALAVVAALVAAGCGGGSKSSNAASTATTATATFDPKAALITLGDLPAGWAAVPTASDRGTFCGKAASAQALAKTAAEYAEGGAIPILQHAVGAYSPGDAQKVMAEFRALAAACHEFESGDVTFTVARSSFPAVGDESVPLVATGDVGGATATLYVVALRVGEGVALVVYGGVNPDVSQAVRYSKLAADKLAAVQ